MEHGDGDRALEHPADDRGALRIEEIVVRVGSGDRDDERRLGAPRETQRERPDPVRVKRVHEPRPIRGHFGLDCRLRGGGEVPHADLDAALAQSPRDAVDRHGVTTHGRDAERSQQGGAEFHSPKPTTGLSRATRCARTR